MVTQVSPTSRLPPSRGARALGCEAEFRQSNHEGELVGWIQEARKGFSAIIINGGAYSHTSVAIHDALKTCDLPVIEVHISNIYRREPFRHHFLHCGSRRCCALRIRPFRL